MQLQQPLFDMRVENYVAALLEANPNWKTEQFLIYLKGERQSETDIQFIDNQSIEESEDCRIEVNRNGFVDKLPQHLFMKWTSQVDAHALALENEHAIAAARQFFTPLEQAIYWARIETTCLENRLSTDLSDFFKTFWLLEDVGLTTHQRNQLYDILPFSHQFIGDWAMTSLIFKQIIGYSVHIEVIAPLTVPQAALKTMQNMQLGIDSQLAGAYQDDIPALAIHISGISVEDLPSFLPNGRQRNILENILYAYFLPFEALVVTRLFQEPIPEGTLTFTNAILGYTTNF